MGIFDVLRAAAMPAAAARAGYIGGQESERETLRKERLQNEAITEERRRYEAAQTRQSALDKQAGVLAQARAELERAQAEQARSHGEYYRKGGARGFKGSGANGELTPKDRARYIQAMSRPVFNPDTGLMEQGVPPDVAAKQFDEIVAGQKPKAPAMNQGGGVGAMRQRGAMGASTRPQAARPDTATTKTATPATAVDSATLAKRYDWLFK